MSIPQTTDIDSGRAPAPQRARRAPRIWLLPWALAAMLIAATLVACGDGGGTDDPGGTSPAPVATPDAARAVKATLGVAGGKLSATAADGTSYELIVPADALGAPVEITMTPVTRIDGLPLSGGMAGAVQLEPAGLRFARMASLRISAAAGTAPPGLALTGFTFAAGDDAVQRSAALAGGGAVRVAVPHFSVHGAGFGSAADLASLSWASAGRTDAEGEAFLNAFNTLSYVGPAPEEQLAAYLRWFDEGVLPMLQRTATDVELLQAASEFEFWMSGMHAMVRESGAPEDVWDPWYSDPEQGGLSVEAVQQRIRGWGEAAGPKFRQAVDANNGLCDEGRSLAALRNTIFMARTSWLLLGDNQLAANGLDAAAVAERLCAQLVVESLSLSDPLTASVPSDLDLRFGLRFRSDPLDLQAVPVRVEFSGVSAVFSNASPAFSDAQGQLVVGVGAETAGNPVTVFLHACLALDGEVAPFWICVDEVVHRDTAGGTGVDTVLPPEGMSDIYGYDLNDRGHVVGTMATLAFVWRGGAPAPLPHLDAANPYSRARGLNNRGDIVGSSGFRAVLWPGGGAPVDLGARVSGLGWQLQEALDINDKGQIFGVGLRDGSSAFFFLDTDNSIVKIADDKVNASVNSLSEEGDVAGQIDVGGEPIGYLWRRGQDAIEIRGYVASVNASRAVAGSVRQSLFATRGAVWRSPFTDTDATAIVPPDPAYMAWPQDIGDDGAVVGFFSGTATDGNAFSKAFHWKAGRFTDLSASHGAGTIQQRAMRVSESGRVLLQTMRSTDEGNQTYFMVVPAP